MSLSICSPVSNEVSVQWLRDQVEARKHQDLLDAFDQWVAHSPLRSSDMTFESGWGFDPVHVAFECAFKQAVSFLSLEQATSPQKGSNLGAQRRLSRTLLAGIGNALDMADSLSRANAILSGMGKQTSDHVE